MKIKIYTSIIAIIYTCVFYGQNGIPNVIPPTPEAANFLKYDFYPANHTTGAVTVDVPIYTIKCRGMELPISISYHTSGIKVNDIASEAGLGWVVNASGFVSVTHKGRSAGYGSIVPIFDSWLNSQEILDLSSFSYTPPNIPISQHLNDLETYTSNTEASVFNYHAPGLSGGYIFKKDINNNQTIINVPKSMDRIIDMNPINLGMTIVSENGTQYEFTKREKLNGNFNNWHLTKMSTPVSNDQITFEYGITTLETDYSHEGSSISISTGSGGCYSSSSKSDNLRITTREIPLLTKIIFPNGYATFVYNNERIDKRRYRLQKIEIYNNANALLQEVELHQSYFMTSPNAQPKADYKKNISYRLKLDSITFKDKNRQFVNNYEFNYNTQYSLPQYFNYDGYNTANDYANYNYFGQDLWGYFNGITNNSSFFSIAAHFNTTIIDFGSYTATFSGYSNLLANRNISTNHAKAAILTGVKYPTGGITNFEYESNADQYGNKLGGMRISRIIQNVGPKQTYKDYKYLNAYTNSSHLPRGGSLYDGIKNCAFYSPEGYPSTYVGAMATMTSYGDQDDLLISGNTAYYSKVEEYQGTVLNNAGKALYEYEYVQDSTSNINRMNNIYYPQKLYNVIDLSWKRGQLKKATYFKNENSIYTPVKTTENFYNTFLEETIMVGLDFYKTSIPAGNTATDGYSYGDILIRIGFKKLIATIEKDIISPNEEIAKRTNYFYDNLNHMQITRNELIDSDGSNMSTVYKYPDDVLTISSLGIDNLTTIEKAAIDKLKFNNQHRISDVVQKEIYRGGQLLTKERTNYKEWITNFVMPEFFQNSKNEQVLEDKIQFYSYYNNGNIREVSKVNGARITFIWGYNSQYPIAKIENASFSEIATALSVSESVLSSYNESNLTQINSLRNSLQMSAAMITTYSYQPLIGITTVTDPKGDKITYTYDNFGRLISVKDKYGNVISENQYNYRP